MRQGPVTERFGRLEELYRVDCPTTKSEVRTEILFDAETIARRVRELAEQISADYRGRPLRLVGILKGAWMFLADLIRNIDLEEVSVDFLGVASYGRSTKSSGEVKITKDLDQSIEGLDVLIVEDILDTGETFEYLQEILTAQPKSLKAVVLLDKPARRTRPARPDYVGFTIPDHFVVGYGLDYAEEYRQLPDVCILRHKVKGE
jgi:hypoxanthine phosphoribosyltransferase